jgi:nucleotide-binding universal stress UspA family protein
MNIQSILVAVDYSACSAAAVTFAAEVARKFGAALDVVHVWDRPAYVADDVQVGHGNDARSLVELIRENAQAEMARFMAELDVPATLDISTRLLAGNPAATLLQILEQGKHQLLVVGTHGRTGIVHLLLGSVAEKLVRLSPVPVLTVPGDGAPELGQFCADGSRSSRGATDGV